jgi:hypothetical protein
MLPIAVPVCNIKVSTLCCPAENRTVFTIPDDVNGDNMCVCVPCVPEGLMFTAEQKDYITAMLNGILLTLSPYPRCPCDAPNGRGGEVISNVGHQFPIKPSQQRNEAGEALWYVEGNSGETTAEAVNPDTGMQRYPAVEECCDGSRRNSPFINNQYNNIQFAGGRPTFFTDMDSGNRHMDDKIGQLFCCALRRLEDADMMVIAQP